MRMVLLTANGGETPISPADLSRMTPSTPERRRQLGLPPDAGSAAIAAALRERMKPVPHSLAEIRKRRQDETAAALQASETKPEFHTARSLGERIAADREQIQAAYEKGGETPGGATVIVNSMDAIRARHAAADRAATASALRAQRGTA